MVCLANHERQFLDTPFYGVRQMTWHLQNDGHAVNEKRIRRLMRLMRLMPIYQRPNTSKPAKGHRPIPPCWAGCALVGPIRSGAPTSPLRRENSPLDCFLILLTQMRKGFLYLGHL